MDHKIKFKKYKGIIFFVFLSFQWGIAQEFSLTYTVRDQESKEPLEGVTVIIEECQCGGITNTSGLFFKRLTSGNYTINLTFLGFKSVQQQISLQENKEVSVEMEVEEEQLSEIVVLAKNNNKNVESTQMGVFELNARELIKIPTALGEFDVLRSMTMLSGVSNTGDVSNGISIRGGSLDQNLLLYDGAPVFNPTHLFGLFSVFTPDVISGVNIYRANIPAKYGGRMASVVDIKVENPYTDQFQLEGGIGVLSSRLKIATPLIKDKLMFLAGGRIGFTDFLFPLLIPRLKNTRANFNDATIKLLYIPNAKNQMTYTHFRTRDFYQLDLISSIENIIASANQYDFSTSNHTFRWLHSFDESKHLVGTGVFSGYTPKSLFPEVDSDNVIEYLSTINYASIDVEFKNKVSDPFEYYVGLQWNQYKINPGSLDPGNGNSILPTLLPNENSQERSLYGNATFDLMENITLSAGLRLTQFVLMGPYEQAVYSNEGKLENIQSFGEGDQVVQYFNPEPRIGLNVKLNESSSIKASYASIFQYIQNIYNTTTPLPTSRWKMSDQNILPQSNDTYSIGWYKNQEAQNIEFSAEAYYRLTENNLTYKPGADFFLAEFLENEVIQAQGEAYGFEMNLRKTSGKVNGFLNYTWSRSLLQTQKENFKDRINNNKKYSSDFDRPHTLNASINFEGDSFNAFSFNFTAQTGRPYTIANGVIEQGNLNIPIYLNRNNARLPLYHRLDFSWKVAYRKDPNKRYKSDWNFTVYNLYGRKNPFNIYYAQRNGSENGDVFGGNPLGSYELSVLKGALVSLTYNFKFQ
ncbi:MAG: TonB-dependent receptor [Flavobacteriaceae bacterium]